MRRTILLLLAFSVGVPGADTASAHRVETGLRPAIKIAGESEVRWTIRERMVHYHVPAVSVAVIHRGKLQWARAYGVIDSATRLPADEKTLFQAASISKPVAALAAMKLVRQGKLELDTDVNRSLTAWKLAPYAFTQPVTVRRLLSHTAGTTVHGFPGYAAGATVASPIQVLDGKPPANTAKVIVDREPGTAFRYSGGGYTILQVLLQDVTGKAFAPLLEELVLQPLKMNRSTFLQPLPDHWAKNAATAHNRDGKPVPGRWHTYPEQAAAGLWTTPTDLAKVLIAIYEANGEKVGFLPPLLAREMLTPVLQDYGLGWVIQGSGTSASFGHGGSNAGFRCQAKAFTSTGDGAVVMTNGDGGASLAAEILRSIAAEYRWPDYQIDRRTPLSLSSAQLQRYAGTYVVDGGKITIRPGGAGLIIRTDSGLEFSFRPESESKFFSLSEGAPSVTFDLDRAGDVTGFRAGRIIGVREKPAQPAK
jgi:CubicO group peptidase (beta-lactamase class C family)